jgi:hypothetical protein
MIAWRLDRDTIDLTGECLVSLYVISSSASLVFVAFFFCEMILYVFQWDSSLLIFNQTVVDVVAQLLVSQNLSLENSKSALFISLKFELR